MQYINIVTKLRQELRAGYLGNHQIWICDPAWCLEVASSKPLNVNLNGPPPNLLFEVAAQQSCSAYQQSNHQLDRMLHVSSVQDGWWKTNKQSPLNTGVWQP